MPLLTEDFLAYDASREHETREDPRQNVPLFFYISYHRTVKLIFTNSRFLFIIKVPKKTRFFVTIKNIIEYQSILFIYFIYYFLTYKIIMRMFKQCMLHVSSKNLNLITISFHDDFHK